MSLSLTCALPAFTATIQCYVTLCHDFYYNSSIRTPKSTRDVSFIPYALVTATLIAMGYAVELSGDEQDLSKYPDVPV